MFPFTNNEVFGVGLDLGIVKIKGDTPRFYATIKASNEPGVSFGVGLEYFDFFNRTNSKLDGTVLRGSGYEVNVNIPFASFSYGRNGGLQKQFYTKYNTFGISSGVGLPGGYVEWHTLTFVSGK